MKKLMPLALVLTASCGMEVPGPGHMDYSHPLAGGYVLSRSSAYQAAIVPEHGWSPSVTPLIPPNIAEVGWDNRYILASQQPLQPDSDGFERPIPGATNYWILDTEAPAVYGPLTFEQFRQRRSDLGVPQEITIRDKHSYQWSTNAEPNHTTDGIRQPADESPKQST
jgi:hypothetical protein